MKGVFLFVFGPFLAALISPNLMEQASIWCFFSILQVSYQTILINFVRFHLCFSQFEMFCLDQEQEKPFLLLKKKSFARISLSVITARKAKIRIKRMILEKIR